MSQGQSKYTRFKYERFAPVFSQSLRISKADSVKTFPYYHVDLNSGGGYNHDVNVPGSPLNFLSAVSRTQRENFYAFFIDHNKECIRELITRPEIEAAPRGRIAIFRGDNAELLPIVAEFVAAKEPRPHYAMGSILIDPNGFHEGVPWEALRTFCRAHPRFDVFVNLNVFTFKRERGNIRLQRTGWTHKTVHTPSTFATWFDRPCWMWTEPIQLKGHSWIQGVGRTMRTHSSGYASLGFYDSESERGRAILQSLDDETPRSAPELPLLRDL